MYEKVLPFLAIESNRYTFQSERAKEEAEKTDPSADFFLSGYWQYNRESKKKQLKIEDNREKQD